MSMRMIPAVPFSVLNYAAGASAVRVLPYTLATLVGLLPGTTAVVILGDALTGNVSPLLFLVSLCTASVGIAGLIYEIRSHRRHHRERLAIEIRSTGRTRRHRLSSYLLREPLWRRGGGHLRLRSGGYCIGGAVTERPIGRPGRGRRPRPWRRPGRSRDRSVW